MGILRGTQSIIDFRILRILKNCVLHFAHTPYVQPLKSLRNTKAVGVVRVIKCLPSNHEALSSNPSATKKKKNKEKLKKRNTKRIVSRQRRKGLMEK
jgi:hypothetical protein